MLTFPIIPMVVDPGELKKKNTDADILTTESEWDEVLLLYFCNFWFWYKLKFTEKLQEEYNNSLMPFTQVHQLFTFYPIFFCLSLILHLSMYNFF